MRLDNIIKNLKTIEIKRVIIISFAVLFPIIIAALAMGVDGYKLFSAFAYISDETNYYLQLKGMLEYGAPIGFNGYNGGTAPISTFGFHGFGCLIPYFLFAKVFGLHYYTFTLCNILMMSLAILFYILVLNPTNKQLFFVMACLSISLIYINRALPESSYHAYSVILATIYIRISRKKDFFFIILGFIWILYMSLAKPTFAILIFPLLMLSFSTMKWFVNLVISLITMAIFTIIMQRFFNLFSSPYWVESQYAIDISLLQSNPVIGVLVIIKNVITSFFSLFPMALQNTNWGLFMAILIYGVVLYFVYIMTLELISYFRSKSFTMPANQTILLFAVGIAIIGTMVMWTGILRPRYEVIRSFFPLFFFAIIAITEFSKGEGREHFFWQLSLIYSSSMLLVGAPDQFPLKHFTPEYTNQRRAECESFLEKYIEIDPYWDHWENTIASHAYSGPELEFYWSSAPAGTGWNLYLDNMSVNEKYILILNHDNELFNIYLSKGYSIIGEDNYAWLLLNPVYER